MYRAFFVPTVPRRLQWQKCVDKQKHVRKQVKLKRHQRLHRVKSFLKSNKKHTKQNPSKLGLCRLKAEWLCQSLWPTWPVVTSKLSADVCVPMVSLLYASFRIRFSRTFSRSDFSDRPTLEFFYCLEDSYAWIYSKEFCTLEVDVEVDHWGSSAYTSLVRLQ